MDVTVLTIKIRSTQCEVLPVSSLFIYPQRIPHSTKLNDLIASLLLELKTVAVAGESDRPMHITKRELRM